MDAERLAWLRLNLVDGVGPITFSRLIEAFGLDVASIFTAPASRLKQIKGVGDALADALRNPKYADAAKAERDLAEQHGIKILTPKDAEYPPGLKSIADAPPVLYLRGQFLPTDALALSIVGTRQPSHYGREQARRFAVAFAQAGFCVVSGFARGVDTEAHKAALAAKGRTIAVIGSGLLSMYPPENESLVPSVTAAGAVVSEFSLRTGPDKGNFPRRNRLIAAMTLGTLVIEAGADSGALITARCAMEYSREVFALPGRVDNENAKGCHRLIKEGAKLVEDLADVLDELGPVGDEVRRAAGEESKESTAANNVPGLLAEGTAGVSAAKAEQKERSLFAPTPNARPLPALSADEATVLAALGTEPLNVDALAVLLKLPVHRVGAALTMLELKAIVKQLAGRHFVRVR